MRGLILADRVELMLGCGFSPSQCQPVNGDPLGGASLPARSVVMTLRDSALPKFTASPDGSLLAGGALTGVRDVRVQATDAGGGLWRAALEVDGREVLSVPFDDRQGLCAQPFAQIQPCAASGDVTLRLDTAEPARRAHQASVVVSDVTGSNRAIHGPFAVRTVNDPVSCAPGKPGAVLAGGLGPARTRAAARRARPRGAARRPARRRGGRPGRRSGGRARAGRPRRRGPRRAPRARDAGSRRPRVARAARRPVARPPARLPRRGRRHRAALHAHVPPARAGARDADAAPRTLAGSRRVVRLSGRLPRAFLPAGGKLVELQAFERGRWHTFKTVRTGARGRYATRYRFGAATRGTFPMRARVRRDAAYPFEPARSKSIVVRVT